MTICSKLSLSLIHNIALCEYLFPRISPTRGQVAHQLNQILNTKFPLRRRLNTPFYIVLQAAGPIVHPWLDQFKQVNGSEKVGCTVEANLKTEN